MVFYKESMSISSDPKQKLLHEKIRLQNTNFTFVCVIHINITFKNFPEKIVYSPFLFILR